MEEAVRETINEHGISLVVAAGNSAEDSCRVSPGRVPEAITVGAGNLPTKFSRTSAGKQWYLIGCHRLIESMGGQV
jgi:subtilisin family serine protease